MLALLVLAACQPPTPVELVALGASSLTDALPEAAEAWHAQGGAPIAFSFDSSSRLERQIEAGAPADLAFFADEASMDALDGSGLLTPGSRRDLVGNALAVAVPAGASWVPRSPADLASPQLTRLALAGENVPAGRYAREALERTGVWDAVAQRVTSGENVRTTLAWVHRGEVDAGVVYATDVAADAGVKLAFAFDDSSHAPIRYPAAVVRTSAHADEAAAFLAFCASPAGLAAFEARGFRSASP